MDEQISLLSQPSKHCRFGQLARYETGTYTWDETEPVRSHHAVVATCGGKLAGILKFNVRREDGRIVFRSIGTFVWPAYRASGLASRLWSRALESYEFDRVVVQVVSDKGKTLVEKLKAEHPEYEWKTWEGGNRPLRDLKVVKLKRAA